MLVATAVIGLSVHRNACAHPEAKLADPFLGRTFKPDKATLFYAESRGDSARFVEMVPTPETSESKAATENLKLVAATL